MRAQDDDVIGADDAVIAQAKAAGEIEAARQSAKVASGFGGRTCEASIVVVAETVQHGVGLLQSNGMGEAKFADQAVLQGAPGALNAAFGFGRVGGDLGDAELLEGAPKLGGRLFSGEFFGDGPVGIVALKDGSDDHDRG